MQHILTMTPEVRQYKNEYLMTTPDLNRVFALTEEDRNEVLEFLAVKPVQTVVMASYIADNGIESELNRGRFYGHVNVKGELDGVALIGHSTLIEARSEKALVDLAGIAKDPETPIHLIMSNGTDAERFFAYMTSGSASPRLKCVEILFEAAFPYSVLPCEYMVKTADMDQLRQVADAQAAIAYMESGVDPMAKDPEGFLRRVARRIEQGRVFIVFDNGELIFKTDIIAETEQTIYLEGIYVHPDHRGRGVGTRCLSALTQRLLTRVDNICLLSNVKFTAAHKTYVQSGYRRTGECVSLFV